MKQYGDAARQQMELDTLKVYFEQLPKIAEAVAKGYMNVDPSRCSAAIPASWQAIS